MSINSKMTNLADAIRAKSGVSGKLTIAGMTDAVDGIEINQGSDIDFSGVNVTADKMLSGVVAINASGVKVTGNIQTVTATKDGNKVTVPTGHIASQQIVTVGTAKSAATITPGTSDQTIAADTYLSGKQTIKGDANLTAENIKSGVRIFAVTGTFEGAGGGGSGGSGAFDLYKCVSVNQDAQSWVGRKAVMQNGEYVLQAGTTNNLSCVNTLRLVKGKVYSGDGMMNVKKAYNHCICIAPFEYIGDALYGDATIKLHTQCYMENEREEQIGLLGYGSALKFNTGGGTELHEAYFNLDNIQKLNAFTIEFWCWSDAKPTSYPINGCRFLQNKKTGNFLTAPDTFKLTPQSGWHHVAYTRAENSNSVKFYIDGVYKCEATFSESIGGDTGVKVTFANQWWITHFKVYDIEKYNSNFTPDRELNIPEWEDRQTLTVSGAGIEHVNGVYELITPNAAGRDRIWAYNGITLEYDYDWYGWMIKRNWERYYSGNEEGEPWESEWWDATDDESGGDSPTVTLN